MVEGKEYRKFSKLFRGEREVCDRCGNDVSLGESFIHFPYRKIYIRVCGICQKGLLLGFYEDFVKIIKENRP